VLFQNKKDPFISM